MYRHTIHAAVTLTVTVPVTVNRVTPSVISRQTKPAMITCRRLAASKRLDPGRPRHDGVLCKQPLPFSNWSRLKRFFRRHHQALLSSLLYRRPQASSSAGVFKHVFKSESSSSRIDRPSNKLGRM